MRNRRVFGMRGEVERAAWLVGAWRGERNGRRSEKNVGYEKEWEGMDDTK